MGWMEFLTPSITVPVGPDCHPRTHIFFPTMPKRAAISLSSSGNFPRAGAVSPRICKPHHSHHRNCTHAPGPHRVRALASRLIRAARGSPPCQSHNALHHTPCARDQSSPHPKWLRRVRGRGCKRCPWSPIARTGAMSSSRAQAPPPASPDGR